jgi:hypothetical protein
MEQKLLNVKVIFVFVEISKIQEIYFFRLTIGFFLVIILKLNTTRFNKNSEAKLTSTRIVLGWVV